jgi:SAM-dependent methyltransferase
MSESRAKEKWESYYLQSGTENRALWPSETMLRIVFGGYLKEKIQLPNDARVLDIGCGTGNNLLPFLHKGMDCYGVEVTDQIAERTEGDLRELGFDATIRGGHNRQLPFEDGYFDLITSINVIHYEKDEDSIKDALKEHARVLKPGGALYLMTAGQDHEIYKRAQPMGNHRFKVSDWDFRDGEQYFYFSNLKYLEFYLQDFWQHIELGQVKEELVTLTGHFLFAACQQKK